MSLVWLSIGWILNQKRSDKHGPKPGKTANTPWASVKYPNLHYNMYL